MVNLSSEMLAVRVLYKSQNNSTYRESQSVMVIGDYKAKSCVLIPSGLIKYLYFVMYHSTSHYDHFTNNLKIRFSVDS